MKVDNVVIHVLDTYPDMDVGVEEVRKWHKQRGWSDIGYHYIIKRDGTLEFGRRCEDGNYVQGAHVLGLNKNSIGIALAGGKARKGKLPCNLTRQQWSQLENLWRILSLEYPEAGWSGHNDHDKGKQCPTFDVEVWINEVT